MICSEFHLLWHPQLSPLIMYMVVRLSELLRDYALRRDCIFCANFIPCKNELIFCCSSGGNFFMKSIISSRSVFSDFFKIFSIFVTPSCVKLVFLHNSLCSKHSIRQNNVLVNHFLKKCVLDKQFFLCYS